MLRRAKLCKLFLGKCESKFHKFGFGFGPGDFDGCVSYFPDLLLIQISHVIGSENLEL